MPIAGSQKKSETKTAGAGPKIAAPFAAVGLATPIDTPLIPRKTSCACGGGCPTCQPRKRQQETMQRQISDEEEILQGKFVSGERNPQAHDSERSAENRTGMADGLKAGLETFSGMDLSGVRVHYNSSKPAQLNAWAYTQGQDIHVGPGQEKHLPHEGWHVVQQMQGRVRATAQTIDVAISDDQSLEREADIMGSRVLKRALVNQTKDTESKYRSTSAPGLKRKFASPASNNSGVPIQRAMKFEFQTKNYVWKIDKNETRPDPLERKFGSEGPKTEDGNEPAFLAVGKHGDPAAKAGDAVEPKKNKPAQYIYTFRVLNRRKGKVKFVKSKARAGNRGTLHWGAYESKYVDRNGKPLNVYQDEAGRVRNGSRKILRRTRAKEQTAIELQSENKGFIEFETPKWFRKWGALKKRIQDAVDMTKAMGKKETLVKDENIIGAVKKKIGVLIKKDDRDKRHKEIGELHEWPTTFRTADLPLDSGRLLVEILDKDWFARIQSSEGIELTQFGSLLREHHPGLVDRTALFAEEILKGSDISLKEVPRLHSFLQIIGYYIERGQRDLTKKGKKPPPPSKYYFGLMSRTSFSSIYREILSESEQELLRELVVNKKFVPALNRVNPRLKLKQNSRFFPFGHGKKRNRPLTIQKWLESIIRPTRKKTIRPYLLSHPGTRNLKLGEKIIYTDQLSKPPGGSAAMGAMEVETEKGKKDTMLVRFETRSTTRQFEDSDIERYRRRKRSRTIHDQPAKNWVNYAKGIFEHAATERKRPDVEDDSTTLENESKKTGLKIDSATTQENESRETGSNIDPLHRFELQPKLTLSLGDEKKLGIEADFRLRLSTLLGRQSPFFVYTGIGTGGLSAGGGASVLAVPEMSLFLAGKGGIRAEAFKAIQIGGGVEAGWAFDDSRSLLLGIGFDAWQSLDADKKRTYLLNLWFGKRF